MTTAAAFLLAGARPRVHRLAFAALLSLLSIASGVALMATAAYLIQQASTHPPILSLTVATVAVRLFSLVRAASRYTERLATHDAVLRLLEDTRVAMFQVIEPRSPAAFDRDRSGELMRRVNADVDALQDFHARALLPPVVSVVMVTAASVAALRFDGGAGAVVGVSLMASVVAIIAAAASTARGAAARVAAHAGELAAEVTDGIQGCGDLIGAGALDRWLARVSAIDDQLGHAVRRLGWSRALASALVVLAAGITMLAALVATVAAVSGGSLPAIAVGIAALGATAMGEPFALLPAAVDATRTGLASASRLTDIRSRPLPIAPPRSARALPSGSDIELRRITLRYTSASPAALNNVSLSLPRGARVGIVGPSGSGKSTLASVLVRFRDYESGTFTIGGVDARELTEDDVRTRIALAAQDAFIFATTIRENLRLARTSATDVELREAARRAHLLTWIDGLPDDWDTRVGEHGARISGGQRRRIALARALLTEAEVVIVDEPTEALDVATAASVMSDVLEATRGRSLIVISHRPDDVRELDALYEMREGSLTPVHHVSTKRRGSDP